MENFIPAYCEPQLVEDQFCHWDSFKSRYPIFCVSNFPSGNQYIILPCGLHALNIVCLPRILYHFLHVLTNAHIELHIKVSDQCEIIYISTKTFNIYSSLETILYINGHVPSFKIENNLLILHFDLKGVHIGGIYLQSCQQILTCNQAKIGYI